MKEMKEAYNAACSLAKDYNWNEIKCVKEDKIRTRKDIHEEIYKIVCREIQKK